MEIKALEFKRYKHKGYWEITEGRNSQEFIKLEEFELNSILSLLFMLEFHFPEVTEDNKKEVDYLLNEKELLFNTSRDFGRNLLESLDGYSKEWLVDLQNRTYRLDSILYNSELVDFVQTCLIDILPIRGWEYGRFFAQNFSDLIILSNDFRFYSDDIKNSLVHDDDYLKKIAKKITDSKATLSEHEQLILALILKGKLFNSRMTIFDYFLISSIAKSKIVYISLRIKYFRLSVDYCLKQRWGINRGKGGPRL